VLVIDSLSGTLDLSLKAPVDLAQQQHRWRGRGYRQGEECFLHLQKEQRMRRICAIVFWFVIVFVCVPGCKKQPTTSANAAAHTSQSTTGAAAPRPQQPSVAVKRVPCRVKLGPLAAALEVDLSELRNIILDAKQLYHAIVNGELGPEPPDKGQPVIMVINKRDQRITYFQLAANVKEVRLKTLESKEVTLVVKNQEPLRIELWVDTANDVLLDVEFKDALESPQK
jgi:hypothetical protein